MKRSTGFTLLEVLVAISVFGVVGFILADLLLRTFRGGNKTQVIGIIKQNGQSALNTLDQQIRGSEKISCVSPNGDTLVIKKENQYTRFKFNPPVIDLGANPPVYRNGSISMDSPQPDSADPVLNMCNASTQYATKYLTDTHTITGVSVVSATFRHDKLSGYKDVVNVQFQIGPAVQTPNTFDYRLGSSNGIQFETTVEIR